MMSVMDERMITSMEVMLKGADSEAERALREEMFKARGHSGVQMPRNLSTRESAIVDLQVGRVDYGVDCRPPA